MEKLSEHMDAVAKEVRGLKRKNEKADSSTPKPRKAKPETPEDPEKKKLQKKLDAAKTKVTTATATLTKDKEAEDHLKTGAVAKRFLDDATKKRENSERKLKRFQDDATALEADFALKFPPDAALAPAV